MRSTGWSGEPAQAIAGNVGGGGVEHLGGREAADGVEALEKARDQSPRLVLLDIMMPRLDGLEVCRQLKADPDTSDIVVVMLTAQAQERDRDQGLAAGADDYFTKPFSPLALLNMVERVRHNQARAD